MGKTKKDIRIVNVEHTHTGRPNKKAIGRQLLTFLCKGYRLIARDEIIGERKTQNYTMLTFARDA